METSDLTLEMLEILDDDALEEMRVRMDAPTLVNFSEVSSRIYDVCHNELQKRKLENEEMKKKKMSIYSSMITSLQSGQLITFSKTKNGIKSEVIIAVLSPTYREKFIDFSQRILSETASLPELMEVTPVIMDEYNFRSKARGSFGPEYLKNYNIVTRTYHLLKYDYFKIREIATNLVNLDYTVSK